MGNGLSMAAKHEITRKFALAYAAAAKRDKSRPFYEVCAITGWNRDNARRQLTAARKPRRVGKKTRTPGHENTLMPWYRCCRKCGRAVVG